MQTEGTYVGFNAIVLRVNACFVAQKGDSLDVPLIMNDVLYHGPLIVSLLLAGRNSTDSSSHISFIHANRLRLVMQCACRMTRTHKANNDRETNKQVST